ncbi:hypothetical protein WJX72_012438 [[Myrmecia] bisecta]|uniref:Beta-adaptin-like protein n=1 Tax=[Myrmecia] bisecta TaxID=41462 RepID=A0AAW1Q4R9_9CHLO
MPGEGKSRGELGEIKTQLAALTGSSGSKGDAVAAKKDLFKKIINYMTIGIDMSSLFVQVMTCGVSNSEDIVLKKMLYLYLSTYAQSNPDLTLLTINLLTKDCKDQDPTIRGLALRSLCSLRVPNLVEYIVSPISQGLRDGHPYMRRTAVMGVLKVYKQDSSAVKISGMLDTVREMTLKDADAQVVANCLSVLQQVGVVQSMISRVFVYAMLNRLKEFSEWAQCQVLDVISTYRPSGEQEVYDIMNVLDDRLSHSNSAVVMATVKVFLHLTLSMPATHQQVLERIKDPLITLVSRDHYETAYAVLAHFHLIAQRAPIIFSQIYTSFYCRMNEPSYIKQLKLEILTAIADETNAYEIATELTEYVNDIDEQLAREAVRAVGTIALEVQDVAGIVERLLGFLEIGKDFITAETIIQIKDLVRRYPDIAEACISSVASISPSDIEEPEAKAAFVWILGEHGQGIQDAPYLLEPVAANFAAEEVRVRLALLPAVAKLFFKRPPESHRLLGITLAAAAADTNQDVHDRALLYYRLLQRDPELAKRIIQPASAGIANFSEEQSAELRDRIFDEFNSLAVCYKAPSSSFAQAANEEGGEGEDLVGGSPARPVKMVDEGSSLLSEHEQEEAAAAEHLQQNGTSTPTTTATAAPAMDFLGMGDLLGGLSAPAPAAPAVPAGPPPLALRSQPALGPPEFQQKWSTLQPSARFTQQLSASGLGLIEANGHKDFCTRLGLANIMTMASGGAPPTYRFYFHAQRAERDTRILVETIVSKPAGSASVTIKADDQDTADHFASQFKERLANL